MHTRFCLCSPRVCFPSPVEVHNQIPLGSNFPGGSQSLCWIPRLGNLLWALELSQQCENSFGITVSSLWVVCSVALWWGYRSCLLGLCQPEPLFSRQATANPCLRRRYSNNPRQVRLSLLQGPWVLVCTRFYLSPLSVSDGYGGLILNGLWPSYHLTGASPFSLDVGYLVFAGIQHSPVNGCSAVSYNFGVLIGEDKHKSFYSAMEAIGVFFFFFWCGPFIKSLLNL